MGDIASVLEIVCVVGGGWKNIELKVVCIDKDVNFNDPYMVTVTVNTMSFWL